MKKINKLPITKIMNHPHELSDQDIVRIEAVLKGRLSSKWVSSDELESFSDYLYDRIAAERQTHYGSVVLQ